MPSKNIQIGVRAPMGEFLTATRREILRRLYDDGPCQLGALHRGRPMTRYHARLVVRSLVEEGLVEVTDVDGNIWSRRVQLTALGVRRRTNPAEGLHQQVPRRSSAA